MSLNEVNDNDEDMKELIKQLRAAIIDSYISIAHGMSTLIGHGGDAQNKLGAYAKMMYEYLEKLLAVPNITFTEEMIRNIYDLFIDIVAIYGKGSLKTTLRTSNVPHILK